MIKSKPNNAIIFTCLFVACLAACHSKKTLFTEIPSSQSNITFINQPEKNDHLNILYYLYYYNGGGVSTGDINNDGLPDIYFTSNSKAHNKLYLNKGNFVFEDITDKAGVQGSSDWCSGVTMADVNGDGFLDIYVSAVSGFLGLKGHNELFINNRDNTFTESSAKYGLDLAGLSTQAAFFDYDHDGDLDCYILRHSKRPNANIVDTSHRLDKDSISGDRVLRNDLATTGKFTDVTAEAGVYQSSLGYGLGLAVADINNDGWEDVYVGNDFHENDYYYINNGNGTFTESGSKHFRHYSRFSMGNDVADYNNDGQLDVITVDMLPPDEKTLKTYGSDENPDVYKQKLETNGYQYQYSKNCLQRNNGAGTSFSEIALMNNIAATDWSWAPLFADFDNDGTKDLFISSGIVKRPVDLDYVRFVSDMEVKGMGRTNQYDDKIIEAMPDGSSHPFLFKGNPGKPFTDVSSDWGTGKLHGYYNGSAYGDLDNDGDLDLVINCIGSAAVILKNNAEKKNSITISFKGDSLNTFGIGAKTYLFNKGKLQYQQLMTTRGFLSSMDTRLHFGLDTLSRIDSVLIVWPDQRFQLLKNISANKPLAVYQNQSSGKFDYASYFSPVNEELTSVNITAPWKHTENTFFDYNVQYLIPHAESTRGPKLAVADVNGDGRDDLYACGALGQAKGLMIQQGDGSFALSDTSIFKDAINSEENDALFFDANGDKYPDLYIVTGGNEYSGQVPELLDRLYLNDGNGHFTRSVNSLPPIYENKSCAIAADADNDGDLDLFVGVNANATAYGIPQTSYLLLNDGKGIFSIAPEKLIDLRNVGMVTAAAFADLNKDGRNDLIVTGEWMPLIIFMNTPNEFTKKPIPQSSGLWQCLFVDDVNGDGNPDILGGNWGLNNKFISGKNGPLKLYTADFDKNGRVDQLLSYTINGQEFPFLAKDEVERQLPLLKKHYLRYAEYAGVPMKDVFYGWIDTIQPIIAERLASAVCFGDGKGGFELADLPPDLQIAPVSCFGKLKSGQNENFYIAGGNFYDVIPYEGRYDGQALAIFKIGHDKSVNYIYQPGLLALDEQVRDVKWMTQPGNTKALCVAGNNTTLKFFKYR